MSLQALIIDFELHNPEGIRKSFTNGIDPNMIYKDKPLIYELITMYTRGPLFKECINVFVDFGLKFEDSALLAVLLDNEVLLEEEYLKDNNILNKGYDIQCAFTSLFNSTLRHICAEYNHNKCATLLLRLGLDVNKKSGLDEYGFGGHTPIFHCVNQHKNFNLDMLDLFLSYNADLSYTIKGLIWGKGFEWETYIPSVNPISYAMMGLLRQFQRAERDIYKVVDILQQNANGLKFIPINVPNKYLIK